MKNVAAIGLCLTAGVVSFKLGKSIGYTQGAVDVLAENDIDSFSKELKNGYVLTLNKSKKKGEDK